jgi:predicted lactoylglutathione lyase
MVVMIIDFLEHLRECIHKMYLAQFNIKIVMLMEQHYRIIINQQFVLINKLLEQLIAITLLLLLIKQDMKQHYY